MEACVDYVDWCETVLAKLAEIRRKSPAARQVGVYRDQLMCALFGANPVPPEVAEMAAGGLGDSSVTPRIRNVDAYAS